MDEEDSFEWTTDHERFERDASAAASEVSTSAPSTSVTNRDVSAVYTRCCELHFYLKLKTTSGRGAPMTRFGQQQHFKGFSGVEAVSYIYERL